MSGDTSGFVVGGKTYGDLAGRVRGPVGDAFVRRFDPTGRPMWTRQFGQRGDDWVNGIAVDGRGVTVVGPTRANASDDALFDGFIRRFDLAGGLRWSRLIGGPDAAEVANDVTEDGAGLTVTGYVFGALDGRHRGGYDVFVRRYGRDGSIRWRTQFGTRTHEIGMAIAAHRRWFVVVGNTQGSLAGTSQGDQDVFVRRYARSRQAPA